jgi:hypothetical protein
MLPLRRSLVAVLVAIAALAASAPAAGASTTAGYRLAFPGVLPGNQGFPLGGGGPSNAAAGPCGYAVGSEEQGRTGGNFNQVCAGTGLTFIGPSIGQVASVIGPTIIGPASIGVATTSAGSVRVGN